MALDTTLMDLPARRSDRVAWADIAKAFSMILLVAYTLLDHRIYLNEMLIYVRMPLFFFVSGLFGYRVVTATSFRELMRDKVTNFLYLYVVWELVLYLGTQVASFHLRGWPPLDHGRMLTLLWDPLFNIWFLYALALAFVVAWLLRTAPAWAVLAGSVAVYCASVATDPWSGLPFLERLVRLFPFFWLGLMFGPAVFRLVEQYWRLWPLALGLFLAAAWLVYPSPLTHVGPLTLAMSLTGIAGFLLLARHVSAFESLAAPLRWIGGATLYIYVMHKLVIFYSDLAMSYTGTHFRGDELLQLILTVPLCALVGRWIAAQPALGWLFAAPWVQERPRRGEPQPMLAG
jgi:uncharacterized membrane protein YcfT